MKILLLLINFFLFSISYAQPINEGLIASFSFDDSSPLNSVTNNQGTVHNITYVQDRNGNDGMAIYFSGNNSYMTHPKILPQNSSNFTISMWAKVDNLTGSQNNLYSQCNSTSSHVNHQIRLNNTGILEFDQWLPDGGWISTPSSIPVNEWVHVSIVQQNNKRSIYLDGALVKEDQLAETYAGSNIDLSVFGARIFEGNVIDQFKGALDDIMFFDRALSNLEINTLANDFVNASCSNIQCIGNNVGIGTSDTKGYKFAVAGEMICTGLNIKAEVNWPDYVFLPEYQNKSLEAIEKYINQNHHLPEVPSSSDIETDGIELAKMNSILLKKIEELTLHLIKMNKQLKLQNEEIKTLKNRKSF